MDLATVDKLLTTTRAVRLRLDLTRTVESDIIAHCLEIAIQAPTGGNDPRYHFIVVTDVDKCARLGELYRSAHYDHVVRLWKELGASPSPSIVRSANYLADHMHEVPVHVVPCVETRVQVGQTTHGFELANILPQTWSFMLALRAARSRDRDLVH